ncbi:MAG: DUF1415 domain-containing protein, partial [Bacteroidetes bacterium]|nr:DUF1415 domain-containing protein [Bacteroidota bacterium]
MSSISKEEIIQATKNWLKNVVIGLNFCPFAAKPFLENKVRIAIIDHDLHITNLADEFELLATDKSIETTLLVYPNHFADFMDYLDWLEEAQNKLSDWDFEGEFQLASFHPNYLFDGGLENDPANYTNRSPYPMLHIIREASLEQAIKHHPDPDGIPMRNIEKARSLGLEKMRM